MRRLLTPSDAGRVLGGLTAASVRRLEREGQLRTVAVTMSGNRLFTLAEVRRLAKKRARRRGR